MTPEINHLELVRYISELETEIKKSGITLELRTDFGYLVRICQGLPNKPPPTAMFNPLHHHIGPENGFWIKGTNDAGEVVHVQAVRNDDLTGSNLASQLTSLKAFYFDPAISAGENEVCQTFTPATHQITGSVCYHGELWIRSGDTGFCGKGLSPLLARIAHAIALLRWAPDFIYGFGYDPLVKNGVIVNYGFYHMQPGAVLWNLPDRDEPLDMWLVWLTLQDLIDLIGHSPEMKSYYLEKGKTGNLKPESHRKAKVETIAIDKEPNQAPHLLEA